MRIDLPQYIMMIGLPGCGKSTYIKGLVGEWRVISSDNEIEKMCKEAGLTYSEGFHKFIDEAQKEITRQRLEAIKLRQNVVDDATNLSLSTRRKKINATGGKYTLHAVVVDLPEETEWRRRLGNRPGKTIPDSVLEHMKTIFVEPGYAEGFDSIIHI